METNDLQTMLHTITRDCIAVRARVMNRAISALYDEALRPFDLKTSQMNILVACAAFGPVRPVDMCRLLHFDASTLSRNVHRLKTRALIEAIPGEDNRTQVLKVLPQGLRLLHDAYPAWCKAQQRTASLLGEDGVNAIVDLGNRLMGVRALSGDAE